MALTHTHKGRVWTEVGREPYTRLDGTKTELIRWQGLCAECSVGFEITTPSQGDFLTSKSFGRLHCDEHKLTKAQVSTRWAAAVKAGRGKK